MEFQNLGNSGLKISKILLGGMSIGSTQWRDWVIDDEQKVFELLDHAYKVGMRTFDTADMYSNGESERWIGKWLKSRKINRSSVVILSKCFMPVDDDPNLEKNDLNMLNREGLSRKHIFDAVDASVERLGTYMDVLQIHRLDRETPKHEIMKALHDVVESGKVRYIGASSMRGTEFAQLQFIAEKNNWTKFISMQGHYNLLYREEEREMIPFCNETGVGLIPWSPLARGLLARPLDKSFETTRSQKGSDVQFDVQGYLNTEANQTVVKRVKELADKKNTTMAAVATKWILKQGCCPIIGVSKPERIDQAIEAFKVGLSDEECKYLSEPYEPRFVRNID